MTSDAELPKDLNNTYKLINSLGGVKLVAKKLNVSEPAIFKWIRNDKIPGDKILSIYYGALAGSGYEVSLDELCHHLDNPIITEAKKDSTIYDSE